MKGGKKTILNLPLKILFTEEGINFFITNNKKLNKFKTADDLDAYGIFLDKFSPASIQQMMLIDYVSKIEVSSTEFMSKRQDVMDLSKLVVYGFLYRQFDNKIFSEIIGSELITQWNRLNPGSILDEKSSINDKYLQKVLAGNKSIVDEVKQDILNPVISRINTNASLLPAEKNIYLFLSEKYLEKLRPFIWFILSRFKGSSEYHNLLSNLRNILQNYMEKSKIAEYLSLMILELLSNAENTNLQNYAEKIYKGNVDPKTVLYDQTLRNQILAEMARQNEKLYLSWKIKGKSSSVGTSNRLEVTIYNRESEYQDLKKTINDKKMINLKEKNLMEFYKELPAAQTNTELGLYYLSYLNDACEKVKVRFESNVSQIRSSGLTVITLNLSF